MASRATGGIWSGSIWVNKLLVKTFLSFTKMGKLKPVGYLFIHNCTVYFLVLRLYENFSSMETYYKILCIEDWNVHIYKVTYKVYIKVRNCRWCSTRINDYTEKNLFQSTLFRNKEFLNINKQTILMPTLELRFTQGTVIWFVVKDKAGRKSKDASLCIITA